MFNKLGLQIYTIRDFIKEPDFADVAFRKIAEMGYTEAHTASFNVADKRYAELLNKHGISVIGTHYSLDKILGDYEETMEIHRMLGTTNIGIGGIFNEAKRDAGKLKEFIANYNKAAEAYAKHGFRLTYHNHNFEFVRIDGYKTMMDMLYEGLDPATTSFVLDTCWVAAGGGDVIDWMEKLEGRLDILHLKDLTMKYEGDRVVPLMTEVGNGSLNWDKIMATAEKIGVKHYIVEQDICPGSPFDSIKMSADFLKKYQK